MTKNLRYTLLVLTALLSGQCTPGKQDANGVAPAATHRLSLTTLKDKIRGGWAGQVIGCSYGGPTEFKFKGSMIQPYQPIVWYDDYIKDTFEADPGLYDDVYMDLTFVEVLEKSGLKTPADSFANTFAHASYKLWHANQAARYNILNGIGAPESGHWKNNPHADDIDFQIEADFAGMMAPGMINTASEICDRTGHIMNYGDGWYGGVFMAALYSTAYVSDDLDFIVSQAMKTIPQNSKFYATVSDVVKWHTEFPKDWERTWFEVQKKHSSEIGCPEGVFTVFNIDASLNAAYVLIGLLYGEKDFYKTIDISTRCGQDSDCNPATAGGILGVILGYDNIPAYWKPAVERVENLKFPYTTITLNEVYALSEKHALALAREAGGVVTADSVTLKIQDPETVRFEKSFEGMFPKERRLLTKDVYDEPMKHDFEGNGIVVMGALKKISGDKNNYVGLMDIYLDGVKKEQVRMPFDYIIRKYDICHAYLLPQGKHTLEIKWVNKDPDFRIQSKDVLIYSVQENKPLDPGTKK